MENEQKTKGHVLLVEDDMFICRAYRDGLERAGYKVTVALNGEEGIDNVFKEKPSIILLDLIIPIKDGFEVLTELKADSSYKDIPVVVLTNLGQQSDIEKCLELGAEAYMVKASVSLKDVVEKVDTMLGNPTDSGALDTSDTAHENK